MTEVLVNLLAIRPGQVGGSEHYLSRLLASVPTADGAPTVVVAAHPGYPAAHPEVVDHVEVVTAPGWTGLGRPARMAAERSWLTRLARRRRPAVVHHVANAVPFTGAWATVVTIHDLQYLAHPEYFSAVKRRVLGRMVPKAATSADLVITPSSDAAADVARRFGVATDRIAVVPHGIDPPGALEASTHRSGPEPDPVPERYVLLPAVTWPHKNHGVVLAALATHPELADVALVSTGGAGPAEADIAATARRLGVAERYVRLGHVSERRLDELYRSALALVFPSRFEGFGAPVVEAWWRRCPVVASTATAVPEVVGDAGVLVDPDDAAGWAAALVELRRDDAHRDRLVEAGWRRAAGFSSRAAAAALVAAWERAAANRRR